MNIPTWKFFGRFIPTQTLVRWSGLRSQMHRVSSLVEPMRYGEFVSALKRAYFILTDSGGVQEEAPALARPVLVLRRETERPEAVAAGVARLIGTESDDILAHARELLNDSSSYNAMARGISPYGDGRAGGRIVHALRDAMAGQLCPGRFPLGVREN